MPNVVWTWLTTTDSKSNPRARQWNRFGKSTFFQLLLPLSPYVLEIFVKAFIFRTDVELFNRSLAISAMMLPMAVCLRDESEQKPARPLFIGIMGIGSVLWGLAMAIEAMAPPNMDAYLQATYTASGTGVLFFGLLLVVSRWISDIVVAGEEPLGS